MKKILNGLVVLIVLLSTFCITPVLAQSDPISQLFATLSESNIQVRFHQVENAYEQGKFICNASFKLPVRIEQLYNVPHISHVAVILGTTVRHKGNNHYEVQVPVSYCLPPGKGASEGEASNSPSGQTSQPASIAIPANLYLWLTALGLGLVLIFVRRRTLSLSRQRIE